MRIHILGNGGALNEGLPYNAFIIDQTVLCELPPDIMLSMNREQIRLEQIETIFVSHLHGDHIFGFPFLILSAFFCHMRENKSIAYTLVAPKGIEILCEHLLESAFTVQHPCMAWMKGHCTFLEIDASSGIDLLEGVQATFFRLNHTVETYGFLLTARNQRVPFAYIADTCWCDEIADMLKSKPREVLIDLNGEDDDPTPVHLSRKVLQQKGLRITGNHTRYYGTHLKRVFKSQNPLIQCAMPGSKINIVLDNTALSIPKRLA